MVAAAARSRHHFENMNAKWGAESARAQNGFARQFVWRQHSQDGKAPAARRPSGQTDGRVPFCSTGGGARPLGHTMAPERAHD